MQRRPLALLDSLLACGDLVEIRLGLRPAFVACHPDLAWQVLTDSAPSTRLGQSMQGADGDGHGLAAAAQRDRRRQRLVMQPAFRHEHLREYVAVMRQEITTVMDEWRDGGRLDLVDEMFMLTTTVALRALFSSQLGPGAAERLRQAFDVFLRGIYTQAMFPLAGSAAGTWQPAIRQGHLFLARAGRRSYRQLPASGRRAW